MEEIKTEQPELREEIRKQIGEDLRCNERKLRFLSLAPLYLLLAQLIWLLFDSGRPAAQAARSDHFVLFVTMLVLVGIYMLIAPGWLYRKQLVGMAWEYDVKGIEGVWAVFAGSLAPGVTAAVFGFFYYFLTLNFWLATVFYVMGFLYILKQLLWKDHNIDTAAVELARFVGDRRTQNQPFLLNQNNIDTPIEDITNHTPK
ncbi:MAG: hypothetical protein ACYC55_08825 [Candidatus Geothermincolia bacterium]